MTTKADELQPAAIRMKTEGFQGECVKSGEQEPTMAMPPIMYGTAWKAERTETLVVQALHAGFRGVDTACQPKHYNEAGVGAGVRRGMEELGLTRGELFLQSKFTPLRGQDPNRVPYDKTAPIPTQVQQSIAATLNNLQTDYVDALLLHSPLSSHEETMQAWRQLEEHVKTGVIRRLGISNCYDPQMFQRLYNDAHIKPTILQNRLYRDSGYDTELRALCRDRGVTYQSFWTLTANPHILASAPVQAAATRLGATPAQVWFKFVSRAGCVPLTGTTSGVHMAEALGASSLQVTQSEADAIAALIH